MRPSLLCRSLGLLLVGWALPSASRATTLAPLTAEQLVVASELIVRGTVDEVWTEVGERGRVATRAQLQVVDVLKGEAPDSELVVTSPGGVYGGVTTVVASSPRFSQGEEVLLFLERSGSGAWRTVGLTLGKYTVRQDPYQRQDIVQRTQMPADRPYDHRFLPLPSEADRVSLSDFEARIDAQLERGWDGRPIPGASADHLRAINPVRAEVK